MYLLQCSRGARQDTSDSWQQGLTGKLLLLLVWEGGEGKWQTHCSM